MLDAYVLFCLFVLGAMMGSFACCQVWRIRKNDKSKWSHCMHCKYRLRWYDNIPILSWLMLGGKCRKCRKKIGCAEILAEIITAVVFVLTYLWWPWREALVLGDSFEIAKLLIFLGFLTCCVVLFIYDAKWGELPTLVLGIAAVFGVVFAAVEAAETCVYGDLSWDYVLSICGALLILPVLYLLMYKVSNEKWVGGGDWILCVPLALMLGNFWTAAYCMFGANLLGCVVMIPVMMRQKKDGNMQIPFGPFLIISFWLAFIAQNAILDWIII